MLQRYKIPTITLYKLQKSLQSLTPLQPDSKSCVAFICVKFAAALSPSQPLKMFLHMPKTTYA